MFTAALDDEMRGVRDVMVKNFTGPSAIAQRELLNESRTQNFFILGFLMLATMVMLMVLFREVRRQHFLAWNDPLTRLPNRAALIKHLQQWTSHPGRRSSITVCLMDLGHFREVNDSLGYEVGDALLKRLAARIRAASGQGIFAARTGSDEFTLIITGTMPTYLRFPFLEQLRSELADLVFAADPAHRVRVFMGHQPVRETGSFTGRDAAVCRYRPRQRQAQAAESQCALLQQHVSALSAQTPAVDRAAGAYPLPAMPATGPLLSAHRARPECGEAAGRGADPLASSGIWLYCPLDIISLAEENGLGEALGGWIIRRMQLDLSGFPEEVLAPLEISINLSNSMFNMGLAREIEEKMEDGPLGLHQLIVELTETIALDDIALSKQIIHSLRQIGVRVALDDFGTGWSSFSYLRELYFDKLKIDRSFITAIDSDTRQALFVETITTLSHQLGVRVVAEGVENSDELKAVLTIGVDEIQGYFYSRPLPLPEFMQFCHRYFAHSAAIQEVALG